jgi:DNA-binding PadR family transcriptional regulator
MTKRLGERLRLAKIVLSELERTPLRHTELEKRTVRQCGTHSTFEGIFRYLKQNGYLEKTGTEHTAPYRITEKGRRFLGGL